jgi:hypothetical protein
VFRESNGELIFPGSVNGGADKSIDRPSLSKNWGTFLQHEFAPRQGCQIFIGYYQNGKNLPINQQIYQMAVHYTKCP